MRFIGFKFLTPKLRQGLMLNVRCMLGGVTEVYISRETMTLITPKIKIQTVKNKKDRLKGLINYFLCQCHYGR